MRNEEVQKPVKKNQPPALEHQGDLLELLEEQDGDNHSPTD